MSLNRRILYYLLFELVVLIVCYFTIMFGSDDMTGVVGLCLIVFTVLGVSFSIYFIVQKIRQKIDAVVFNKCFWIALLSAVLPFAFLFIVLSQLH